MGGYCIEGTLCSCGAPAPLAVTEGEPAAEAPPAVCRAMEVGATLCRWPDCRCPRGRADADPCAYCSTMHDRELEHKLAALRAEEAFGRLAGAVQVERRLSAGTAEHNDARSEMYRLADSLLSGESAPVAAASKTREPTPSEPDGREKVGASPVARSRRASRATAPSSTSRGRASAGSAVSAQRPRGRTTRTTARRSAPTSPSSSWPVARLRKGKA